jgi:hypothetical protein
MCRAPEQEHMHAALACERTRGGAAQLNYWMDPKPKEVHRSGPGRRSRSVSRQGDRTLRRPARHGVPSRRGRARGRPGKARRACRSVLCRLAACREQDEGVTQEAASLTLHSSAYYLRCRGRCGACMRSFASCLSLT